jgi:transcription elongation GreA/GreB family factor
MQERDAVKRIEIGNRVRIICPDGVERTYKIGVSKEADPDNGVISNLSPLGMSLLGSKVGDKVAYSVGENTYHCEVLEVLSN